MGGLLSTVIRGWWFFATPNREGRPRAAPLVDLNALSRGRGKAKTGAPRSTSAPRGDPCLVTRTQVGNLYRANGCLNRKRVGTEFSGRFLALEDKHGNPVRKAGFRSTARLGAGR